MADPIHTEKLFESMALVRGYEVLRGGWPDYLLVKGEEVLFIEVKSTEYENASKLSLKQARVLRVLQGLGLTVRIAIDGDLDELVELDSYLKVHKPRPIRKVG